MMKTPTLDTERLILRPLCMEDAEQIQEKFNNWNVIKIIGGGVPWPYPDDGAITFLESILPKMEAGETYGWAITLKSHPEELIGQMAYRHITEQQDHRSFWLGEPYWGKGYMTEAIEAVQDFIFFDLGVEKIIVKNSKSNEASRRIKEKTGARLIGEAKSDYHEGPQIEEIWEVTKENWSKVRTNKNFPPQHTFEN